MIIPAERLEYVRKLFLKGRTENAIQQLASARFGVTQRAVRRYIKRVKDKLDEQDKLNPAAARRRSESIMLDALKIARGKNDAKTMALIAHRMAEIEGALGPQRLELTGKNGEPIQTIAKVVNLPPLLEPADATSPVEPKPEAG